MKKHLFSLLLSLTTLAGAHAGESFPAIGCTNVESEWNKGDLVSIRLNAFKLENRKPTKISTELEYVQDPRTYGKKAIVTPPTIVPTPDRMPRNYTVAFLERDGRPDGSRLVIAIPMDRPPGNRISAEGRYYSNAASRGFIAFYCKANDGTTPPGPGVSGRN